MDAPTRTTSADLRERADRAEAKARQHGQPEGAGFLDGFAHALRTIADECDAARERGEDVQLPMR